MTTKTTSEIVQTIADQINSIRGMHPSKQLMVVDPTTLRVHTKIRGIIRNVDIRYMAGDDLYEVTVTTISMSSLRTPGPTDAASVVTEGVYADSLENFFPERVILHSS